MKTDKLKNRKGETIAEVLVASLVVVLGVLLFASMVVASFHIISNSEKKMQEFYQSESKINDMSLVKEDNVNSNLTLPGKYTGGFSVDGKSQYKITVYGNDSIKAYKKKN